MALKRTISTGLRDERYQTLMTILVKMRKELGLSQQEVADRTKLYKQLISRIETGQRRVDVVEFVDLVRGMGLDPAALIADIPEKKP